MKPLIVLIITFLIALVCGWAINRELPVPLAGRIAMSVMLLFTSIAHFKFTDGMTMMVPDIIPYKRIIVYATGILEIIAAITLLVPETQHISGWVVILLFIVMLPANIFAAINHINYEKATRDGNSTRYLWFRIPLQILFIAWVYLCAIHVS